MTGQFLVIIPDGYYFHFITLSSILLILSIIIVSYYDIKYGVIPNAFNIIIFFIGLLTITLIKPELLFPHFLSSIFAFLFFLTINYLYLVAKNRHGIGGGDAKLYSAAGMWVGFEGLFSILFWASLTGIMFSLFLSLRSKETNLQSSIAFGPHLCLGLWLTWLFGPIQFYI